MPPDTCITPGPAGKTETCQAEKEVFMDSAPIIQQQPRLKVFNRQQTLAVHSAALEILEKTGIKLEHDEARRLLVDNGGRPYNDQWVRIPAYLAEQALRSAPRQIMLYDQNGQKAMELRDDNFYYGTGLCRA